MLPKFIIIILALCLPQLAFLSENYGQKHKFTYRYISPDSSLKPPGYSAKFIPYLPKLLSLDKPTSKMTYTEIYNNINLALNKVASMDYQWKCSKPQISSISKNIKHYDLSCSGKWPSNMPQGFITEYSIKDIIINFIIINPKGKDLSIKPFITAKINDGKICADRNDPTCLKSIYKYSKQYNKENTKNKLISAINGGYFMVIVKTSEEQRNCFWKQKYLNKLFSKSISTMYMGNVLTIIDGITYSNNCALFGNDNQDNPKRASFLITKKGVLSIQNLPSGPQKLSQYKQGIGGGPSLILDGEYNVDWQGLNPFFEFTSNSSLVITEQQNLILLSINGIDNKSGVLPFEVANLVKAVIEPMIGQKIVSAMTLDRGYDSNSLVKCKPNGDDCKLISNNGIVSKRAFNFNGLGIFLSQ